MVCLTLKAHGKALLVAGDTRPIKDALKSLGGRWMGSMGGWCYPGSKKDAIAESLRNAGHQVVDEVEAGALPESKRKASVATDSDANGSKKQKQEAKPAPEAKNGKSTEDGDYYVMLAGERRRARVTNFNGRIVVDIREYYEADGEMKPGKKGIMLGVEDWQELFKAGPEINEQIKKLQDA
mmetsp:Transcript_97551/g.172703  ORF Transcript_97551/g.172703 Transcript_97551/m.172703 type:complete len:181 (-) Transcript_97551:79-621(-)